jgi:hypothetical protein
MTDKQCSVCGKTVDLNLLFNSHMPYPQRFFTNIQIPEFEDFGSSLYHVYYICSETCYIKYNESHSKLLDNKNVLEVK